MKYKILFFLIMFCALISQEQQTFKLEDGTKITGLIISEEEDFFEIETDLGLVQIHKKDIKQFECIFFMNNGNILVGSKVSSSDNEIILSTDMGVFKIKKEDYFLWLPKISNEVYISLMFLIAIFK